MNNTTINSNSNEYQGDGKAFPKSPSEDHCYGRLQRTGEESE